MHGTDITRRSVAERIAMGMSVLPEDRLREGILPNAPLYETFYLGLHHHRDHARWNQQHLRALTRDVMRSYNVIAPSEDAPTGVLSGGNIQKVLVARALAIASGAAAGIIIASH